MLITSTFLLLVFTGSVRNSALQDDLNYLNPSLKSYNYNHPPLFEMYEVSSDPDEFEVREIRQIKPLSVQNENVSQLDESPEIFSIPITSEAIKETEPNIPTRLNLNTKIPVSVVYDSETDLLSSNNKQLNNTTNKIKKRKRTRRPNPLNDEKKLEVQPEKSEDVVNNKITTEKSLNTSPSPKTVVPKIFTKRPPEDNPVLKKIRQRDPVVKILEESNFVYAHKGNFHYSFEGADGTKVSSEGELKSFSDNKTGESVSGSVFYTDNDGNDFSLSYTADENGYRPQGAHLPTPPPIPPAIARALAHLATKTTPEPVTEKTKKHSLD